ncbi:flagellar motor protein MotB [Aminipila sp.]|uniref:flagellar motor protein MotB n=1 Tax=Aminipila sp. TaxID=2060095 RepID=UPI00289D621B|nr:flagellar motor protein MotB [Aminipila sp.]
MAEKKKHEAPKNNWMDTYGDMVTLLLCFFVLLFSISTVNAEKWVMVVKSFNPAAAENISQLIQEDPGEQNGEQAVGQKAGGLMTDEKSFDQIYWSMKKFVEDNNLQDSIEVKKGKDFTFIIFRNNIFFNGDSYVLRQEGKDILDVLCSAITPVADQVGEIRVMGHTNQADPNKPNPIEGDRFLSSNRATQVLVYIETKNLVDGKKLFSMGYGQHYPIASFVTEADRAKNRRVEIYIAKNDATKYTLDEVYDKIDKSSEESTEQKQDQNSKPENPVTEEEV